MGDACATLTQEDHEASLRNLEWFGGVYDVEEVVEVSINNHGSDPGTDDLHRLWNDCERNMKSKNLPPRFMTVHPTY